MRIQFLGFTLHVQVSLDKIPVQLPYTKPHIVQGRLQLES